MGMNACSSGRRRFPVMKIPVPAADRAVLLCYFWVVSLVLVFFYCSSLLPKCIKDYGSIMSFCVLVYCIIELNLKLNLALSFFLFFSFLSDRDEMVHRLNHGKMLTIACTKLQIDLGFYSK